MIEPHALVGKVILIGVSIYRASGEYLRQTQLHGIVKEIDDSAGIIVEDAATGKEFFVPPAYTHIHSAAPGVYRARDTGDEVVDPDFVTQWSVRLQENANETTIDWQQPMEWRPGLAPQESESRLQ